MSLVLEDGKGSGSKAQVRNNRLSVDADIHSTLEEHSEKGDAYSWTNTTYNYTAADTIIGIRNTSADKNLYIDRIYLSGDATSIVTIHRVNGSAALAGTGSAISAVNLNGTSGQVAPAEAFNDETTNSAQGEIILNTHIVADTPRELFFDAAIILGPNDMLGIDYVTVGAAASVTVIGFFNVHER